MPQSNDNPRRSPALQHFLDGFMERAGITEGDAKALLEGSDHPYQCRCPLCLDWWCLMGAEIDEQGRESWGPFTEDEIAAGQRIRQQSHGPVHEFDNAD